MHLPGEGATAGAAELSAGELQACLARLYVDAAFRRLLDVDPDWVVRGYRLTDDERACVLALDRAQLGFFAETLRAKRRMRMAAAYPRLFSGRLEGGEACFERYHDLFAERAHVHPLDDVRGFGRFARETYEGDEHAPWRADLVRYSVLLMETRVGTPQVEAGVLADDACPRLAGDAALDTFATDVLEVVRAFDAGEDPSQAALGEFTYALKGTLPIAISRPVRSLLERSDGHTRCADIAPSAGARAALQSLYELGVLVTAAPTAAAVDLSPEGH